MRLIVLGIASVLGTLGLLTGMLICDEDLRCTAGLDGREARAAIYAVGIVLVSDLLVVLLFRSRSRIGARPLSREDREELAALIERFIGDSRSDDNDSCDWDDFISIRGSDLDYERLREEIGELPDRFPIDDRPTAEVGRPRIGHCNEAGIARLREIARMLRSGTY